MKNYLLLFIAIFICSKATHAQTLQSTPNKIKTIRNASFTEIVKFKFSFQDEFSIDTLKTFITVDPAEKQIGGYYKILGKLDTYLYDGNKAIWLNLRDTTYRITSDAIGGQYMRTVLYWKKEIERYLKSPSKIKVQADTVIGKGSYDHYLATFADTVQNEKHVYSSVDIIIDKRTLLPYKIRSEWKGFADDGAYMGMFEEHTFEDYKLNNAKFPDLSTASVPQGFKLPVKKQAVPMLAAGTQTPDLKLKDLMGADFDLTGLRGKVVLLNFTTDGCPHCVNAAQMLKQLYARYKSKGLEIVSVYQSNFNSINSVKKFDAKHDIKYPSYMAEGTVANTYHVSGYPNFYLVDKQGVIIQGYEGYYAELEKHLTEKIEAIK